MRWPWLALLVLAGALAGGLAVWLVDTGAGGSRTRTEAVVHDYLLSHPEVIPEAMEKLQQQRAAAAVGTHRAAIDTAVGDAWGGNPHGDVTVAEYYDYNCGFCRASLPVIRQLLADDPGVRIVYHQLPILAPSSKDAAEMALAAAKQGRFKPFHDALYAAGPVSADTIAAAARAAGVDTAAAAAMRDRADDVIRANLALAGTLDMSGTPTWVIGDRVISGALPLDEMKAAVAAARKAG